MEYLDSFINYLKYEKRYSPHTILSYSNDLQQFFDYLSTKGNQIIVSMIDERSIRDWIVHLLENKISSRSVNRKITTLKTFFKYLLKEKKITSSPMSKVISPKTEKKLPVFVEQKHMDLLLDEIDFGTGYEAERNKLMIELFYISGIRLSELINLKETDINLYNNTIKVLGKRNKERIIPFPDSFKKKFSEYLKHKHEFLVKSENNFLFLTDKGNKIYTKLVYRIIQTYLKAVTTIDKKSPHVLRHTFATHMLNNGADLNAIKEFLGHSSLAATQVYTHNTFEKLKKIYKQAHPRA